MYIYIYIIDAHLAREPYFEDSVFFFSKHRQVQALEQQNRLAAAAAEDDNAWPHVGMGQNWV